jgi:phosphate starvation-inducible protein PhoH and related proteins
MKNTSRRKAQANKTQEIEGSCLEPTIKYTPITCNQKIAWQALRRNTGAVFLAGSAGTGKSMLAAAHGAMLLKSKRIDKILLLRPAVGVGKTIGYLKGTLEEKMAPYFAQIVFHLSSFLGDAMTKYCLENKKIEMGAVEYTRSRSFENILVIVEESQNAIKNRPRLSSYIHRR